MTSEQRLEKYRAEVRATMQKFSDAALAYQDSIIIGGIDREECDRELAYRSSHWRETANHERSSAS